MEKFRIIESKDKDGNTVKVGLKSPGLKEYRDSQIEYNKAFREALDSGALLRQKLTDYMRDQGIWNEAFSLKILTCFCHAQELTLPDTPITNNNNLSLIFLSIFISYP